MLIALVGPACSGKYEIAKYLIVHHHFRPAFLLHATTSKDHNDDLLGLCHGSSHDGGQAYDFPSAHSLLEHSTAHWRDNIVTMDLKTRAEIEIGFDKRPFFLLIGVDAPVTVRWKREVKRCALESFHTIRKMEIRELILFYPVNYRSGPDCSISLEQFVIADDNQLYGLTPTSQRRQTSHNLPMTPSSSHGSSPFTDVTSTTPQVVLPNGMLTSQLFTHSLRSLLETANMTIQNPYSTLSALHTHLSSLSLSSTHRLRPSWDTYFLSLCTLASLRSNCMKRRVGAVLIRNNRVLSTGYNGTPRGLINCAEGGCSRCNGGAAGGTALDECLCLHAEENALLECGRERGGAEGTVLYCNT